jgi:hypothetical protein
MCAKSYLNNDYGVGESILRCQRVVVMVLQSKGPGVTGVTGTRGGHLF